MTVKEWIYNNCDTKEKSLIKRLLFSRGITNDEDIKEFLHPLEMNLTHPNVFCDMKKASQRICTAIDNKEKIVIYGDFDADGVTATSVLYKTLKSLGADVNYFIPDREKEGHGFDTKAIVKLMTTLKPKVIISVDCGISDVEAVDFINSFKIDVIITDHHEAPEILPKAYAIINPKAQNALEENLSPKEIGFLTALAGVGVAFKLAQALLEQYDKLELIYDLLPFVAVGTVADLVPLIGENRYFVAKGLEIISNGRHYGLKRLLESAGYKLEKGITAENIAFGVAPRINASGRLDTVEEALKVLLSENKQEIEMGVISLNEFNKVRQELCQNMFLEAEEMIKKEGNKNPAIVLFKPDWHIGIIGIVASKLVEKYYKPTFLMTFSEEANQYRCSARSVEGINLYDVINANGELLDGFGGHAMAAGLSFSKEKHSFEEVKSALNQSVKEMSTGKDFKPFIKIDLDLNPKDVNINLAEEIALMEPFGSCNPEPVFTLKNLVVKEKKLMGENKDHLRLTVDGGGQEFNCIRWQQGDISLVKGDRLDVAFHPQKNEYNGNISVQLIVDDIHSDLLAEETEEETQIKIYDHRNKTDIFAQVNDYVKNSKLNILIFAENKNTLESLKPYSALSARAVCRKNIRKCDALMLFDYPADKETFDKILSAAEPKAVHFMNYEIKYFDEKDFIKTFSGMLRYAHNNLNGVVELYRCSAFFCKSCEVFALLMDMLEETGFIKVHERTKEQYKINFIGNTELSKILHLPLYAKFLDMIDACETFQKSLLEDDINNLIHS